MGKQNNTPEIVSQEEFDKNLDESMNILIDDGADDETINTYIEDYKSRFKVGEVKKKDSSVVSESPRTDGSLESNITVNNTENKKVKPLFKEVDRFSEIGKGLKDVIIPRTKQQEVDLINKYTNDTSVSEEDENAILKDIESDDNNEGVWNTIKKGAKDWWNGVFDAEEDLQFETDNLKESRTIAENKLKKQKKEITPELLKEETYNIELRKRKKILKIKKTEDFIENLQDDKNLSDLSFFKEKFKMDLSKDKAQSIKLSLDIDKDNKQIELLDSELKALNQKAIDGIATEADRKLFNQKREELQSLAVNIDSNIKEFNNLDSEISSTKEEIDLFKRNYNDFENATGRFAFATADLGLNVAYLLNEVNQLNTVNPIIPLSSSLSVERALSDLKKGVSDKRELLKKDVKASEIRNLYDAVEWGSNIITTQAPQLIMMSATGGAGLGITALSSGGEKAFQIDEDDKKSGKITDPLKKIASIGLATSVTYLSEKITLGQLNKVKRVFKSVPVPELKQTASQYVKNNYKEYFKDVTEETLSEVSETIGNNLIDGVILGKDVKWHNGIDGELLLSTAFMANMFKAPALAKDVQKAILRKDYNQVIGENNSKILKYNELIINSDLSDSDKSDLKERSEKLLDQNNVILEKAIKKASGLSAEKKNRIFQIENEIFNYRKKYQRTKNASYDQNTKEDLLKDIEKDVEVLEGEREGILKEKTETNSQLEEVKETENNDGFSKIDEAVELSEDTEFNPIESEGESINRLANSISENKPIEQVAKEHKDSYLEYLKDENASPEVLNSEFVKTFESRLISALKNPKKFNANQERSFENGSRIDSDGKIISEEKYLSDKGNLKEADVDSNKKQENTQQSELKVETNTNNYTVKVDNGNLSIEPELGSENVTISKQERKNIVRSYEDNFDFSKGETVSIPEDSNINEVQLAEEIAENSNNPLEIVNEYSKQISQSLDSSETNVSKDSFIADALKGNALTNESKSEVTDLGSFYTNIGFRNNKDRKSIDQIREIAESNFGSEINYQDVLDFLNQYPKVSDFTNTNNKSNISNDLKDRFKQITGLDLNKRLLSKIQEKYNSPKNEDSDVDNNNDVPFQRESNQTRISGQELTSLVDRLLKTGLANDVNVMSDSEINNFLEKEGVSSKIRQQIIGQGALLSDTIMTHLELAKELDKVNETPKGIKRLTGWEKGFDGKWRYETPNDFTIKGEIPFGKTVKLEDLNPKSELFKAYPFLKFTEVTITKPKKIGFFKILIKKITGSPIYTTLGNARVKRFLTTWKESVEQGVRSPVGEINVFLENKKHIESTLNHEIQHIIQTAEGFAQGGNSELFNKPTDVENFNLYQRIAGEVEARNVQTRMKLSPEERKKKLLSETEDISREDQFEIEKYLNGDIQLQQEMSSSGVYETPNGFVYKGNVYLNRDKVKRDTPIHEFGHLWNSYIKKNNKDVYDKGLELIEGSEYHNQVLNNPAYDKLSKEDKLEEALAQAIGEKGVKILNESKKSKFNAWFNNLFKQIARGLGLRNMSGDKLSKLTLDKFTDLAGAELLSGQEITPRKTKKENTKSIANNIDVVVQSETARIEERKKILDEINSKKSISEDVRKKVVKYITDKINNKNIDEVKKREVKSLLNSVRNSKTKKNLLKAFNKIDDVFLGVENKVLIKDIKKVLDKKLSKKESGRRKANLVTEEVESILKFVKDNVFSISDVSAPIPLLSNKRNKINQKIAELIEAREAIKDRNPIFSLTKDKIDIESISISIDILTALISSDKSITNKRLSESLENLTNIYTNGRSELIELRNKTKEDLDSSISEYIEDADLSGERTTKSNQEIDKENKSLKSSFSRGLFTIASGKLTGNLDSIMTIISKKGGNNRDSSPLVNFVSRIKNRETLKKRRISRFSSMVSNSQKDIFGSIRNADVILNRKQTVTIRKKPFGSDQNTPKNEETREYTNSELLNLWMNHKNPKLRKGLENNGFDEKFFSELKLPSKVTEYGEFLFSVYEEMHVDTDNVYRKMNYHSMGKEDFYAGKVYREDVDNKKEDLKLEGGSFSVNTTGFGSQKERTSNDKPIQAVDVNSLVLRAISETSHYTAYAEVHREMSRLLDNKEFNQVVRLNNGKNGDLIIDMLRFYKERDLEKGGHKGNAILDLFGRNITRATLALKAKVGITQTISFLNGATDMPSKPVKPFITYYNPVELVKTMRFLLKESEYLKNRYDVDGIENAVTGLSDIANKSVFSLENNTLEANRKAFSRFMNQAINISLSNVKYGDMFGLSGAVPAYMAWRDKFESEGLSKEKAHEKALRKFEASADRSQQTTSSFGKSPFQRDPVGRYLAMFATSPIQNMQNANYHWRELVRGLSKNKESKGTNFQNIMGILNYQFAQPMLYTYIANLMAGSLLPVLGIGEEEPDDLDKSLANSALLSNYGSIPAIGGILQLFLDKATGKEFSFGSLINSPMISFIDDLNEDLEKWMNSKNKQSQVKYRTRTLKKLSALIVSVPNILTDTYLDFEDIYWNDDVDSTVKLLKSLGWSNFTIEKARTKRISKIKGKREKVKAQRKWNKSLKKYERQKKLIKTKKVFKEGQDKR